MSAILDLPLQKQSHYTTDEVAQTYRKVNWRLILFLFICYMMAYLDRINVGFAQLQMKGDLGFSDAVYGLGAGIFFAGYFLFEVPSNLILVKIGVRKTMMRIMICWGLISMSMLFVSTPMIFYILRFLLGAFEAGFLPGIIFYLTLWYPGSRRARIIAVFMSAVPVAGVLGGPISGWIMNDMEGMLGMHGWQWMFLLQGAPTVLLGLLVPVFLVDKPENASWLSARQKGVINHMLALDRVIKAGQSERSFNQALKDPRVYLFSFIYFTIICGVYAVSFWLPTIIKGTGVTDSLSIGLYSMIPYGFGAAGMVLIGRHSDLKMERRWHLAFCTIVGGCGLIMIALTTNNLILSLAALSLATATIFAGMPVFWAIPTSYLSSSAAAGGIAMINSLALLGGFVSPTLMGWAKTSTGNFTSGLYLMAGLLFAGGIAVLVGTSKSMFNESRAEDLLLQTASK
ncbi:MFS transporter [Glaciimonas sp. PCH181]|uniref:MFS transporter n=1 Tax=Glaciimonas sp. PCH181 TaxID=2133943 RepID=UPI000D37BE1F|nr:MFS transporter [Glaciimonas sp. PCH181]PUA17667.1 MFS transporter [Glaciimonas sp. PCH181]